MNAILTVNTIELMKIWGELVECYHGVNGYGGSVAEIYTHRLMPYTPSVHSSIKTRNESLASKLHENAASVLVDICIAFEHYHDCSVRIEKLHPRHWLTLIGKDFKHRARVEVGRLESDEKRDSNEIQDN